MIESGFKTALTFIVDFVTTVGIDAVQNTATLTKDSFFPSSKQDLEGEGNRQEDICQVRLEAAQALVAAGADVTKTFTTSEGREITTLHLAQEEGCSEVVTYLLNYISRIDK